MSNDFFGHTSAIPRPPENPGVVAERERRIAADIARGQRETEAILARARAGRAEVEQRREAVRQTAIEASIEAFKAEQREAYKGTGVDAAQFERLWPGILADRQRELANADPLAEEKDRIRKQSNYSM